MKKQAETRFSQHISGMLLCLSTCIVPTIQAQETVQIADQVMYNPPELTAHGQHIKSTGTLPEPGRVDINLTVKKTQGRVFNPTTNTYDTVSLRTYVDQQTDTNDHLVGPTISVMPGDRVRLNLSNQLSPEDQNCQPVSDINTPHNFNATNLHSHGLWISPAGNSDNVLIKIDPGVDFNYEWQIPDDHPAGTFWYHPHLHGSTALQVSSGMAGALIIRGNRLPENGQPGDIDTLLQQTGEAPVVERIAVFGQMPYACRDKQGTIKTAGAEKHWSCDEHDVGTIEGYDQLDFGVWQASGRYISINGHVMPTFAAQAGDIERWRLIHAGVAETIKPSFHKVPDTLSDQLSAISFAEKTPAQKQHIIHEVCAGPRISQLSLAMDGLTRHQLVEQKTATLQPGYREDLLMVFPEPGTYCLVDEAATDHTVGGLSEAREVLGFVQVSASGKTIDNVVSYVRDQLIQSAQKQMPEQIRTQVLDDLQALRLTHFVPHKTVTDDEVTGQQTLSFNMATDRENGKTQFEVGELDKAQQWPQKLAAYAPDRVDRDLVLGDVEEWTLKSFFNSKPTNGGHPFHIHVNPFQIVKILNEQGDDVSAYHPDDYATCHGSANDKPTELDCGDEPYAGLKHVWKDTLFVPGKHTVIIRTRYQRYIGEFVLHCHILEHEDRGMMQNVRISLPGSDGKPARAHH
ncbi:MAG: multicopper oxidase family protein [Pseudomonadota bacterium]